MASGGLGRCVHGHGIGVTSSYGFFAKDVGTGLEDSFGVGAVRDIGGADGDDVGAQLVHHAPAVVVCVGDAVAVGGLLGFGQGVIEHADHFYGWGQLQPSGEMTNVGDHACTDDGYFIRGHVFLSFCSGAMRAIYQGHKRRNWRGE